MYYKLDARCAIRPKLFVGVNEVKQYDRKGYYMVNFDLRSGYQKSDNQIFSYSHGIWNCVSFLRLSYAGHIFTRIVRTLVNYWISQNFPIIVCMYLDDEWACATKEEKKCIEISTSVLSTILHAGFVPNYENHYLLLHKS